MNLLSLKKKISIFYLISTISTWDKQIHGLILYMASQNLTSEQKLELNTINNMFAKKIIRKSFFLYLNYNFCEDLF